MSGDKIDDSLQSISIKPSKLVGSLKLPPSKSHAMRWLLLASMDSNPTEIKMHEIGKDVQAMLKLGRSMGAAMVAISVHDVPLTEYSPRSIKKAVTGNGNASKEQVSRMLPHIVEGTMNTRFADSSDALGVAYCHYLQQNSKGLGGKKYSDWSSYLKDNPDRKANF